MKTGNIVAVCTSIRGGLPKYPCGEITVEKYGARGDYHCREQRPDFKNPTILVPNDRHLLIVSLEALVHVSDELSLNPRLRAGSLGENLTTIGLGDLSDILPGAVIWIGTTVVLRVLKQNKPCKHTAVIHSLFNKTIYTPEKPRRGLLCTVEKGIGFTVRTNEEIRIL